VIFENTAKIIYVYLKMDIMNNRHLGFIILAFTIVLLLVLTVVKVNVDNQEAFLCEEVHKDPDIEMAQCPAHTSNNSWMFLIAFGIGFLALGLGVYLVFAPRYVSDQPLVTGSSETVSLPDAPFVSSSFPEIDLSKLDEDETKIYSFIKENEGSVYQSDIIKVTGFSKVKITRILDKMEQKKILERKRRGMANLIVLK
jgi:hypothetical protein